MKKTECINSDISRVISRMGHFDTICVGDAGLPIPDCTERIDLAVKLGIPSFIEVLEVVLGELKIQKATIANELVENNPELLDYLKGKIAAEGAELAFVAHSELKAMERDCKAVIRTGECKPYANIILESNVTF